jgi:hypothetical protein
MNSGGKLLVNTTTVAALALLCSFDDLFGAGRNKKFSIGTWDRSIGKSRDVEAFDVAKQLDLMVNDK